MTAVRFVRKVDGETPTVFVELHKKEVLDRRTLRAEAESAIKDSSPDAMALHVLSTLIAFLTDDKSVRAIKRGKSAEKEEGRGEGEAKGVNGDDIRVGTDSGAGSRSHSGVEGRELLPLDITGKERVCVYQRGDVLEALSDCVVVLKRLPVLLAQQTVLCKLHADQREAKENDGGDDSR